MHNKGSRHIAAEYKLKEKDLKLEDEIKKRIALSDGSVSTGNWKDKPLLERTMKAAAEVLSPQQVRIADGCSKVKRKKEFFFSPNSSSSHNKEITEASVRKDSGPCCFAEKTKGSASEGAEHQVERLERRERELNFTAAGWKRDGNGRWFRDENVEFDSDEEDPNICLS
ncbi:hypothetical protein IFM89_038828 [Coptis chinensis]|uniref:Sodium channel modifier 1 acidic C-terminal domain-containing protein n=1 Tax=Coptis chinensis TaxID=261450 RepID=A0A835HTB4_9MAGN|nr:hypothetical protein IFM89_038828 [Coptis chinensis]